MASVEILLGTLVCVVCLLSLADGYSSGAGSQACTNLSPNHGGSAAQTANSPYGITVSSTTYTPGGSAVTESKPVYWVDVHSAVLQVQGGTPVSPANLVSSSVTTMAPGCLLWATTAATSVPTVPSTGPTVPSTGPTVVATGPSVPSTGPTAPSPTAPNTPAPNTPAPNTPAPNTTPAPTSSFTKDPECGSTKGCLSDCSEAGSCGYLMTWQSDPSGTAVVITLKAFVGSGDRYVAFGLSHDNLMGDDSVSDCTRVGGSINVYNSKNTGTIAERLQDQSDINLISQGFVDGVLTCTFTRPKIGSSSDVFNLDSTKYIIFIAIGPAFVGGIGMHDDIPDVSAEPISLEDVTMDSGSVTLTFPLIKVHGSLMMVAWIFAASIGLVVARYFKTVWPDSTWCGQKIWFQIHRASMVLVLFATVTGFVIIFVEVGGYSEITGDTYKKAHPILGIVVTILCVVNPIMALFRPGPKTPNRPIFNWAHQAVGTAAHITGVVTIACGVLLEKSAAPDYIVYVLGAFAAWHVFAWRRRNIKCEVLSLEKTVAVM
ncbi:hypothetical protein BaRGS_00000341, partial [Batillaria attramentaria]